MTRLYKIVDWEKHFEIAQSKRPSKLSWVPIPNKHDGSGYKRITRLENPCEIFTAWVLIVQVASKCPERGVLKKNGIPLTPEDLSICTDFPIDIFIRALSELSNPKIGWISYDDIPDSDFNHTTIIEQSERDMSAVDYRTVQYSTGHDTTQQDKQDHDHDDDVARERAESKDPEERVSGKWIASEFPEAVKFFADFRIETKSKRKSYLGDLDIKLKWYAKCETLVRDIGRDELKKRAINFIQDDNIQNKDCVFEHFLSKHRQFAQGANYTPAQIAQNDYWTSQGL